MPGLPRGKMLVSHYIKHTEKNMKIVRRLNRNIIEIVRFNIYTRDVETEGVMLLILDIAAVFCVILKW